MKQQDDFLVEILTEELPPKSLIRMGEAFCLQIKERLKKADLAFTGAQFFATPRRLAVLVKQLASSQPTQTIQRKGPSLASAFTQAGEPTSACLGFARSCGVEVSALQTITNNEGAWVGVQQTVPGKSLAQLLPEIVEAAALAIPVARRMRWGSGQVQFVRPIHGIVMLYGEEVIEGEVLSVQVGRKTLGHRFMAPVELTISSASAYEEIMASGFVMVDTIKRRAKIRADAYHLVQKKWGHAVEVLISSEALLDEVTGLVEWPVALSGDFDEKFLTLPKEVLVSAMQDHQRYFPVIKEQGQLAPYFVTISNIESKHPLRVVDGNERVLRARLQDAAFFYAIDQKQRLESRLVRLKGMVFQAKLGTLYDKSERISKLSQHLASQFAVQQEVVARAGWLAKTDLATQMVGEFPELQGVMGRYYAAADGEQEAVCLAIVEHYLPRFAGDALPQSLAGCMLALADRLDTLVGIFGINEMPTGDKDPYGLRRAALGCLRILIEKQLHLSLDDVLSVAVGYYGEQIENKEAVMQTRHFIMERLRAYYQDQGVPADVFQAVSALSISDPYDFHKRIQAVLVFKSLPAAIELSMANKRVSNILSKYNEVIHAKKIDSQYFTHEAEEKLAALLEAKSEMIFSFAKERRYQEVLMQLAELAEPIAYFFEQVMVMTEHKLQRDNRLLLLSQLRVLFLQVADVALLQ